MTPTIFNAGPDAVTALFAARSTSPTSGPTRRSTPTRVPGRRGSRHRRCRLRRCGAGRTRTSRRPGLNGKTIATPQLGNTQDVALRYWLKDQGLAATEGGGDVSIEPQANAEGLAAYASGSIDGAWVPEPWVSEYVKAGRRGPGRRGDLWPGGQFVTTNVIVRTEFLEQHPDVVEAFLAGHVAALDASRRTRQPRRQRSTRRCRA